MSKKFTFMIVLFFFLLSLSTLVSAQNPTFIEYILDASSSMNAKLPEGITKIAAAKSVLITLIEQSANNPDLQMALRVYGAKSGDSDEEKPVSCRDSELVIPFGPPDLTLFTRQIQSVQASGYTPIAYSLQLAGEDFPKDVAGRKFIVLISDGKETCDGDPVALASSLKETIQGVGVYTIGFGVDEKTKQQLTEIAQTGGGKYFEAKDAGELLASLQTIQKEIRVEPQSELKPGEWISQAPEIVPGVYHAAVGMHEVHFYRIKAQSGQKLTVTALINKTPYQAMNSVINQMFTLQLFRDTIEEVVITAQDVIGNPEEPVNLKVSYEPEQSGWVYIALSASINHDQDGNPIKLYPEDAVVEPSLYTLKVSLKGEATGEVDSQVFPVLSEEMIAGGSSLEEAVEVPMNSFITNSIGLKETRFYKVIREEGSGDNWRVSIIVQKPWYNADNGKIALDYILKIYDEDWGDMGGAQITFSKNPASPRSAIYSFPLLENEEIYLSITASDNHAEGDPSEIVPIYPRDFNIQPAPYSILVQSK